MIRLNLHPKQPVCLLQWNSALAINYPARELYNFKRGVSFEEIQSKSQGNCVALHLPVIGLDSASDNARDNGDDDTDGNDIIEKLYMEEYNQPQHMKTKLYNQEKNVMRKPYEGKASLERYRIASMYIFETIQKSLESQKRHYRRCKEGKKKTMNKDGCEPSERSIHTHSIENENNGGDYFILEKASVDELYLDVTKICYDFTIDDVWNCNNINIAMNNENGEEEENKLTNTNTQKQQHNSSFVQCDQGNDDGDHRVSNSSSAPIKSSIHQMAIQETVICAKDKIHHAHFLNYENMNVKQKCDDNNGNHDSDNNNNDNEVKALQRGCVIARGIRKAVYDKLGFTLSAGISTSKLVAKLGASYGKPNGQAVILPKAIPFVMSETPIRKARNLGGKIGKEVSEELNCSWNCNFIQ